MSSLESTQARFFLEQIALPWFKNEHPLTKRVIEAVPLDKGDYRPDPISRTAFELAWHIAAAENRFLDAVAAGEFAPLFVSITFEGFKSRCTTPCRCALSRASAISIAIFNASSSGNAPFSSRAASVCPSRYSITR